MECHSNPEVFEIDAFGECGTAKSSSDQNHLRVKPIRIVQLIISGVLLGLTISLAHPKYRVLDYGNVTLLGIVNFSFFLIEIVDAVSQFGNDPIPDTPMFVFGSCGVILFLIVCGGSTAIFVKSPKNSSSLLLALGIISFFNALIHLLDVVLIFLFENSFIKKKNFIKMMKSRCAFNPTCASPIIPRNCQDPCTMPMAKPIRIFQFLLVSILFSLTIYTISKNSPYYQVEGTLLIVLFGSFLFITLVDIISQFGGDPIPDTPMFLFGVVGILLYVIATVDIYFVARKENFQNAWRLTLSIALSAASSLLFLFDVIMIFLYGY